MHKIMTDLHQDHVNLAKLLTLLEQQAGLLATGISIYTNCRTVFFRPSNCAEV